MSDRERLAVYYSEKNGLPIASARLSVSLLRDDDVKDRLSIIEDAEFLMRL